MPDLRPEGSLPPMTSGVHLELLKYSQELAPPLEAPLVKGCFPNSTDTVISGLNLSPTRQLSFVPS